MINLQEKLKVLQGQLQQKVNELQNIENARIQTSTEAVELRGKVKAIEELIAEEKTEKSEQEEGPKKEEPKK